MCCVAVLAFTASFLVAKLLAVYLSQPTKIPFHLQTAAAPLIATLIYFFSRLTPICIKLYFTLFSFIFIVSSHTFICIHICIFIYVVRTLKYSCMLLAHIRSRPFKATARINQHLETFQNFSRARHVQLTLLLVFSDAAISIRHFPGKILPSNLYCW